MPVPRDAGRRQEARAYFADVVVDLRDTLASLGEPQREALIDVAEAVSGAWEREGKLLVCGNGGSAADSQHIVAELVGRFLRDRPARAALALTTNTSILTAVGNDYGFERIFARQVEGLGRPGDVLLVISTSGNSLDCVEAVRAARERKMAVHGFLGGDGGALLPLLDGAVVAPSSRTPRIQEIHITMGHCLCSLLEQWCGGPQSDGTDGHD